MNCTSTIRKYNVHRLGNKHMYFRMGLKKMLAPSGNSYEQLNKHIRLEVDNKFIDLPELEGIIVLNILR